MIKSFNIKYLKQYEYDNNVNILKIVNTVNFYNAITLIKLNYNCSEEEAGGLLDTYLNTNNSNKLVDIFEQSGKQLFGFSDKQQDEYTEDNKIKLDIFSSLTELYSRFALDMMENGIAYSEFWEMNTDEMFSLTDVLMIKAERELNKELTMQYTQAALMAKAMAGKLDKEPPRVDIAKDKITQEIKEQAEYNRNRAFMEALMEANNRKYIKEGDKTNG